MTAKKILLSILAGVVLVSNVAMAVNNTSASISTVENVYTEEKQNILVTSDHPEFTLKLKSNPTTGYSWFLREYDANLISPLKHSFVGPDKKLMGAAGYELWTFRVKASGFTVPQQTTLRLIYARPWQGAESATQQVFRITTHSIE